MDHLTPLLPFDDGIRPHLTPLSRPDYASGWDLQTQFEAFHRLNPHVYDSCRRIALDLKHRGFHRFGIGAIFERLRWLYALQTQGDDYKLNNNHRAFYARLLMEQEPELRNFFELRAQLSQRHGGHR